jgi:type IV pilus assembly protein PilP
VSGHETLTKLFAVAALALAAGQAQAGLPCGRDSLRDSPRPPKLGWATSDCFTLWATIGQTDSPKPCLRNTLTADDAIACFIERTKREPGEPVEPLPEVKRHETAVYSGAELRSPFAPGPQPKDARSEGTRPQYLEQFQLNDLRMVGTLRLAGTLYGLVRDPGGKVHRVGIGDYMGTRQSRVTEITTTRISLAEDPSAMVSAEPVERPAALTLR